MNNVDCVFRVLALISIVFGFWSGISTTDIIAIATTWTTGCYGSGYLIIYCKFSVRNKNNWRECFSASLADLLFIVVQLSVGGELWLLGYL